MTRIAVLLTLVRLLSACGSSAHPVVIGRPPVIRPPSPTSLRFSTASNRAAAQQNVRTLIRIVVLPRDAHRVANVPASAAPRLRDEWGKASRTPGVASVRRIWIVPESPRQVVRFIRGHARPRPRPEVPYRSPTYGVAFRANGSYEFPPVPGRSWSRWLTVDTAALPGGATVIAAQAGDEWTHTPPRAAEIPKGTKRIDIVSRVGNGRPNVLVHVRSRYDVGSIVALTNGLGLADAEPVACFAVLYGGPTVTLRFRTADGRILAVARVPDPLGHGLSSPCDPLELTIRGRTEPPRIGADLLLRLQRLLNIDLAPPLPWEVASCLRPHHWTVQAVTPTELAATHGAHGWTISFHRTGKVTTNRPAPRTLRSCLRAPLSHDYG